MIRDDAIRIAEEAGLVPFDEPGWATYYQGSAEDLHRFAEFVIADFLERTGQYVTNDASREAVINEAVLAEREESIEDVRTIGGSFSIECEDLIRSRGGK